MMCDTHVLTGAGLKTTCERSKRADGDQQKTSA